jgi:hypothetical protein
MGNPLGPYITQIIFIIALLGAIVFFVQLNRRTIWAALIITAWTLLQGTLAYFDFYYENGVVKVTHFPLLAAPALLCILILFLTKGGRAYIDGMDLRFLTYLHIIRIPVEITLYYMFGMMMVPKLMTFEGNNFDIISGITAPVIGFVAFAKGKVKRKLLLVWNFICLGLLFNIVILAILSAPLPIQQLAFDMPNTGVFQLPFNLLPSVIVPIVLLSHLASIRKLMKMK